MKSKVILMTLMIVFGLNVSAESEDKIEQAVNEVKKVETTTAISDYYEIKEIEVKNLREIPSESILEFMNSRVGSIYNPTTVKEDFSRLISLDYIKDVVITQREFNGGIKLTVDITEEPNAGAILNAVEKDNTVLGDAKTIISVSIDGNNKISDEEIYKAISFEAGDPFSRQEVLEIQKEIFKTGYFKDVIPEVIQEEEGVKVTFILVENEIIKNIEISGNTLYTDEELLEEMDIAIDEIYNLNTLKESTDKILKKYNDDGYILAEFSGLNLKEDGTLDIFISEGIINSIEVKRIGTKAAERGERRDQEDRNLKTEGYIIERELEIKEGEIFKAEDYRATVTNIMRTGLFKNVNIEDTPTPDKTGYKDIVLYLEEAPTTTFGGGISYGSSDGLTGSLFYETRNFGGKNQTIKTSIELNDDSDVAFTASFLDPWIKGTDRISGGGSLYRKSYSDSGSDEFNQILTNGISGQLGKGLNKNTRVNGVLKFEMTETEDTEGNLTDDYNLLGVVPSISHDTRNHFYIPSKGHFIRLTGETGYIFEDDGDDNSWLGKAVLDGRFFHKGIPMGEKIKNTMAYRAVGGVAMNDTKETHQFRVGGDGSVRGLPSDEFRGTKQMFATIENRTQFNDIFGLAVFYDVGRAWGSEDDDVSFGDDLRHGAGIGFRVNSPIGPMRFDFGWPINDPDYDEMEFYFGFGQSF